MGSSGRRRRAQRDPMGASRRRNLRRPRNLRNLQNEVPPPNTPRRGSLCSQAPRLRRHRAHELPRRGRRRCLHPAGHALGLPRAARRARRADPPGGRADPGARRLGGARHSAGCGPLGWLCSRRTPTSRLPAWRTPSGWRCIRSRWSPSPARDALGSGAPAHARARRRRRSCSPPPRSPRRGAPGGPAQRRRATGTELTVNFAYPGSTASCLRRRDRRRRRRPARRPDPGCLRAAAILDARGRRLPVGTHAADGHLGARHELERDLPAVQLVGPAAVYLAREPRPSPPGVRTDAAALIGVAALALLSPTSGSTCPPTR